MTLCDLGVGATFGESILHDLPRDSTVVTKTTCELLRVEQQDFRLIWEVNKFSKYKKKSKNTSKRKKKNKSQQQKNG